MNSAARSTSISIEALQYVYHQLYRHAQLKLDNSMAPVDEDQEDHLQDEVAGQVARFVLEGLMNSVSTSHPNIEPKIVVKGTSTGTPISRIDIAAVLTPPASQASLLATQQALELEYELGDLELQVAKLRRYVPAEALVSYTRSIKESTDELDRRIDEIEQQIDQEIDDSGNNDPLEEHLSKIDPNLVRQITELYSTLSTEIPMLDTVSAYLAHYFISFTPD